MTTITRPPKDFDLPTKHISGPHHIPRKARGAEAELRRGKPEGWVVARQQRNGLLIAKYIFEQAEDPESQAYTRHIVGAAALGSACYTFAENAPTMRRRLKLPRFDLLRYDREAPAPDTTQLTAMALAHLERDVTPTADTMVLAVRDAVTEPHDTLHKMLGRGLGTMALTFAAADIGNIVVDNPWLDDSEVQTMLRTRGLEYLETVNSLTTVATSSAGLAEPDGALALFVRETAPDPVFRAFDEGLQQFAFAA